MKHDRVSGENRKALPKFLLILLVSAVGGGVLGLAAGLAGHSALPEYAAAWLEDVLRAIAPWAIPAYTAALLGGALWIYRSARARFNAWDGEEERVIDAAEGSLNWALLLGALTLILDFFFMAVSSALLSGWGSLTVVGWFLLSAALEMLLQQKVVDLEKRMNPEKRGSVYDTKFQRKWLESCDEAEQRQIGRAAYRAFQVTNTACVFLWLALVVLNMVFDLGLTPVFSVLVIWGILQVSYILECIRIAKGTSGKT